MSNDKEVADSLRGCYGERVNYAGLVSFLEDAFLSNEEAERDGTSERFATCVWGAAGTGKTAIVKQHCSKPVEWCGKTYPGYRVYDVPIAQFEEMGDLHGMPSRHVRVSKGKDERWVPEEVMDGWLQDGWSIVPHAGVRTMYAPPDWVPCEPGPSILLLDDWNRASIRIIKGIMQLLQNYGMVSWQLPAGCNIVLTANPDEQDYLVTSIDSAILTRIRSVTLVEDAKEWAVWAQSENLDHRGISFVLRYPEMMIGPQRTNPRTLAQCFRDIRRVPDLKSKDNVRRFKTMASSLLDDQTVSSLVVFSERDAELVISPERVIEADSDKEKDLIEEKVKDLMSGTEKRIDVIGVMIDRLFAYIVQPTTNITKKAVENFQWFILIGAIPEDIRHNICLRLYRHKAVDCKRWLIGNKKLSDKVMEIL